jgi:hypothetical protein
VLAETSVEIGRRNTLFGRAEYVEKDMDDLFLPHVREVIHEVQSLSAGYVFDAVRARPAALGIGVRGAVSFVPDALATFYGDRRLTGGAVFVRLGFERSRSVNSGHTGHAEHAGH